MRGQSQPRLLSQIGREERSRSRDLDAVFSALSDPTRRAILERLSREVVSVTELAKPFHISLPAVSKHLKVLRKAGLLTMVKDGRIHNLQLAPQPLISTLGWMEHYRPLWETQLESLSSYLEQEKRLKHQ